MTYRIAIAGWSLRREHHALFGLGASHLQRYATRFNAVEISSSFYRPHRSSTYARWAQSVPSSFRFAVKMPREITHIGGLKDCGGMLEEFLTAITAMSEKLGPVLVQLPPSLALNDTANTFFSALRGKFKGPVTCEPRHASWFTKDADAMLKTFRISRVAADPALNEGARMPGGWRNPVYYRPHGSPRMYYSAYDDASLGTYASHLRTAAQSSDDVWCVFDNTAQGEAMVNAFALQTILKGKT